MGVPDRSCTRHLEASREAYARRVLETAHPSFQAWLRVERYGSRATVSFESLHIRIPIKFCQNSGILSQFFRNYENFRTSQHFQECSAKFRKKKSSKIGAKFDENCRNIRQRGREPVREGAHDRAEAPSGNLWRTASWALS